MSRRSGRSAQLAAIIESFCQRTNDGLAAMALVLALALVVSAVARNPDGPAWPTRDAETGLDGNDPAITLDGLLAP